MLVTCLASLGAVWEGESYAPTPGVPVELPDGLAQDLIAAGVAVAVEDEPADEAPPEDKPAKGKK